MLIKAWAEKSGGGLPLEWGALYNQSLLALLFRLLLRSGAAQRFLIAGASASVGVAEPLRRVEQEMLAGAARE
jgi:hypothetical protein